MWWDASPNHSKKFFSERAASDVLLKVFFLKSSALLNFFVQAFWIGGTLSVEGPDIF